MLLKLLSASGLLQHDFILIDRLRIWDPDFGYHIIGEIPHKQNPQLISTLGVAEYPVVL